MDRFAVRLTLGYPTPKDEMAMVMNRQGGNPLSSLQPLLTKEELELLPYASLIITSEDGIRFLMDHIDGDTYYNIYYPGQNLDRSRTQLKLVEDMEKKLPEIKNILRKIYAELGLKAQIK